MRCHLIRPRPEISSGYQEEVSPGCRNQIYWEAGTHEAGSFHRFWRRTSLAAVLGKLFFMDGNYFVAQSVAQSPWLMTFWGLDVHLASPPGTLLPTPEIKRRVRFGVAAAFFGWPTPVGYRTSGPAALVREKVEALETAQDLLQQVRVESAGLSPENQNFLVRLFEDLVFFARAYRWLLEAEVHYYLWKQGESQGDFPDRERFQVAQEEVRQVADEWQARYPADRYALSRMLRGWLEILPQVPD